MSADGSHPPASGGLLHSVRALADGLLASAHQRLELFALELREEKLRAVQVLAWLGVAVFAGLLGVVFGSLALVYAFWETARLTVLSVLAVLYLAAGGFAVWKLRQYLRRAPRPFEASLAEIKNDRACFPPPSWTS